MNPIAEDILMHYGVGKMDGSPGRGSGRYPLGSGENPNQHGGDFLSRIDTLKSQGMGDTEIARALGMSTTEFRAQKAIAKEQKRASEVDTARRLRDQGLSLNLIADKMGYSNDSSVRALLNKDSERRMNLARSTAEMLKKQIAEKGMIDVGRGVERSLGISQEKLEEALYILKAEGYPVYGGGVPQATNPGRQTVLKVVCPPGTEHKDIYNYENIHSIDNLESHDGGDTFDPKFVYPKSLDSKRLKVRYAEDGGIEKDGLVELRRGVDDISLGGSTYAQVRILVDNTHYIKGMAVYSNDMPDGVDVIFNTNKPKGTPVIDGKNGVLKPIKSDPDNPFGSLIKEGIEDPDIPGTSGGQRYYYDKDGKKQLSLINKRAEEGDWGAWADHLPSQFLSKQNQQLIQKQLGLAIADKKAEYDEICSVTNPTVKKVLLNSFADDCDAHTLSSGTIQEEMYADYANHLKALANQARKEMMSTGKIKYDASAKAVYQTEVDSLNAKLNIAMLNAPKERQAQLIAKSVVDAKKKAYPDLTKAEIKKLNQQALTAARVRVGAKRTPVSITDREWEAIQSGAISEHKLSQIITAADIDKVRQRATPRTTTMLSAAKVNKMKAM